LEPRKILIVAKAFYPENSPRSFRATELAKEFSRQGYEVTVITPGLGEVHDKFALEYGCQIKDLGKLSWPDIKIKGNRVLKLARRGIRRLLNLLIEYPNIQLVPLVKRALRQESGYNLLISIAVPHPIHWGVAWAWNKKYPIAKTWVADCGDPYMGTNTDSFKKLFYFKYFEKWWCRKVDYVIVPFAGAVAAYYKEFRDKVKIIPQGFNFAEAPKRVHGSYPNRVPTFAYAGTLIPQAREIGPLLEHLFSLSLPFRFIIYTNRVDLVEPYIKQNNEQVVEVNTFLPRKVLLAKLADVDFLVNINNSTATQSPSKLIDYYLIGRPVLSISHLSLNKEVIKEFLQGNYTHGLKYDDPEQYRIERIVDKFIALCNLCVH
jgi:glycosyl transferase family 4